MRQETSDSRGETGDIRQETRDRRRETGEVSQDKSDRRRETEDSRGETGGEGRHETGDMIQET